MNNTIWVEKYRPVDLSTFVGNQYLKNKIKIFLDSGDIPHLLLSGPPGVGKTTIAKILKNTIDCDSMYVNASDKGGIDFIRTEIIPFASSVGFKPLKIIVLDECDFLSPQSMAALRHVLETFSKNTRFILTCNYVERIIEPIQSRCQIFKVLPPSRKEVALHSKNVLDAENVEFDMKDLALYVNSGYPDIRRIINLLQQHTINKKLASDTESIIQNDYKLKLLNILKTENKKTAFINIRQLLADNQIKDFSDLFALLYDTIDDWSNGHIAECILAIADAQFKDNQVVDHEINAMAMIINLLNIIKE